MTLGNYPQPLTRRQLREQARGHEPASTDEEPIHAGEPKSSDDAAPAPLFAPRTVDDDAPTAPVTAVSPGAVSPGAVSPGAATPTAVMPGAAKPGAELITTPEHTLTRRELREMMLAAAGLDDSEVDLEIVSSATGAAPALDDDIAEDALDRADASSAEDDGTPDVRALNPPVGHWSIDRDVDSHTQVIDQAQPFDQLISRGVAAGGIPTTTNALILPSIPQQGMSSGALSSTGEILITGSIDLPRSLGATGQHPDHFDSSEMDHMLDQLDEAGPATSVAPVSASRAVSTHTSTRGVMTKPKKRGASLPIVLAITAGVLLVGVLALFAAGYLFRIF